MENGEQLTFEFEQRPTIKGFPELRWTGKRPYRSTQYYPAQLRESYGKEQSGWINKIFWGDNLQVMSHLLKEYRGKIDLIYIVIWSPLAYKSRGVKAPAEPRNTTLTPLPLYANGNYAALSRNLSTISRADRRASRDGHKIRTRALAAARRQLQIIYNPPYMEDTQSDSTRMPPVYNKFMDAAYTVADKVELITPARFLFDAGYTPKEWNQKMLNDEHFKVLTYEPDASKVFSGPEIKGGVVVSYRDSSSYFGAIGVFTKYPELNAILRKVREQSGESMESIIAPTLSFKLSKLMLEDYPNSIGRLRTSAFTTLSEIFFEKRPKDNKDYVSMIGVLGNKRTYRYVRRDYLVDGSNTLDKWTYLMPNASGSGEFGEKLTTGVVAGPGIAFSQTFNAFGCFNEEQPTLNIEKYIKSKFARSMLGVLKITQHLSAPKWKYVPLQDFTGTSDIDWSRSIPEIDQQLYKKYSLSDEEIEFIETHVKEMA